MTPTVEQIENNLNEQAKKNNEPGTWSSVVGVFALSEVMKVAITPIKPHGVDPVPNKALMVKLFVNSETGELRMFPARLLGFPEKEI